MFHFTIHTVQNITSPNLVSVTASRGSKVTSTVGRPVVQSEATFNDRLSTVATLYRSPEGDSFDSKEVIFEVKEAGEGGRKGRSHGTAAVDLSQFADARRPVVQSFPLSGGAFVRMTIEGVLLSETAVHVGEGAADDPSHRASSAMSLDNNTTVADDHSDTDTGTSLTRQSVAAAQKQARMSVAVDPLEFDKVVEANAKLLTDNKTLAKELSRLRSHLKAREESGEGGKAGTTAAAAAVAGGAIGAAAGAAAAGTGSSAADAARIAELEKTVERLTAELADSEKLKREAVRGRLETKWKLESVEKDLADKVVAISRLEGTIATLAAAQSSTPVSLAAAPAAAASGTAKGSKRPQKSAGSEDSEEEGGGSVVIHRSSSYGDSDSDDEDDEATDKDAWRERSKVTAAASAPASGQDMVPRSALAEIEARLAEALDRCKQLEESERLAAEMTFETNKELAEVQLELSAAKSARDRVTPAGHAGSAEAEVRALKARITELEKQLDDEEGKEARALENLRDDVSRLETDVSRLEESLAEASGRAERAEARAELAETKVDKLNTELSLRPPARSKDSDSDDSGGGGGGGGGGASARASSEELATLRERVAELEREKALHDGEIESMESMQEQMVSDFNEEIEGLKAELRKAKEGSEGGGSRGAEAVDSAALEVKIAALEKEKEHFRAMADRLRERISELEVAAEFSGGGGGGSDGNDDEIRALREKVAAAEKDAEEADERARGEVAAVKLEVDALMRSIKQKDGRISSLEEQLETEADARADESGALRAQVQELKDRIQELEAPAPKESEEKVAALESRVLAAEREAEAAVEKARGEVASVKLEVDALMRSIKQKDERIGRLEEQIETEADARADEAGALRAQAQELKDRVQELEAETEKLAGDLEAARAAPATAVKSAWGLSQTSDDSDSSEEDGAGRNKKKKKSNSDSDDDGATQSELLERISALESEVSDLKMEAGAQEALRSRIDKKRQLAEDELGRVKAELDAAKEELETARKKVDEARAQVERVKVGAGDGEREQRLRAELAEQRAKEAEARAVVAESRAADLEEAAAEARAQVERVKVGAGEGEREQRERAELAERRAKEAEARAADLEEAAAEAKGAAEKGLAAAAALSAAEARLSQSESQLREARQRLAEAAESQRELEAVQRQLAEAQKQAALSAEAHASALSAAKKQVAEAHSAAETAAEALDDLKDDVSRCLITLSEKVVQGGSLGPDTPLPDAVSAVTQCTEALRSEVLALKKALAAAPAPQQPAQQQEPSSAEVDQIVNQLVEAKMRLAESEGENARLHGQLRKLKTQSLPQQAGGGGGGDEELNDKLVQLKLELSALRKDKLAIEDNLRAERETVVQLKETSAYYGRRVSQLEVKVCALEEENIRLKSSKK